jgi:hypothetical protein
MPELTADQQVRLLDITEAVMDREPLTDTLLDDLAVVYQFFALSAYEPAVIMGLVTLLTAAQQARLTHCDILTEEMMLDLHIQYGFSQMMMVQWLRELPLTSALFFETIARENRIKNIDTTIKQARMGCVIIDGVYIESIPAHFGSLNGLVESALANRMTIRQFQQLLWAIGPSAEDIAPILTDIIARYGVFDPIKEAKQLSFFRVATTLVGYMPRAKEWVMPVMGVFDHLLNTSSMQKTCSLLNSMPDPIILGVLPRIIHRGEVTQYLNAALPQFHYGCIRKIVRRHAIELYYRPE